MKRILVFVTLTLVAVLLVGGCDLFGGKKAVLVMGTEATFAPFEFTDEDNNPIGFDVDLAKAVSEELGRELEIRDQSFDGLIGALQAKQIDIIVAGMTITEERKQTVAFSDPYYNAKQAVVVLQDDARIKTLDDLKDKVIAVQAGTTGAQEAEKIKGTADTESLKQFKKVNEAFMELKNGRADAVIIDSPVAASYMKKMEGFKLVEGVSFSDEQFGIAIRKDDEKLLNEVNKALQRIVESGKYDELIQKWFGE